MLTEKQKKLLTPQEAQLAEVWMRVASSDDGGNLDTIAAELGLSRSLLRLRSVVVKRLVGLPALDEAARRYRARSVK